MKPGIKTKDLVRELRHLLYDLAEGRITYEEFKERHRRLMRGDQEALFKKPKKHLFDNGGSCHEE